jgi:hypothetical protein
MLKKPKDLEVSSIIFVLGMVMFISGILFGTSRPDIPIGMMMLGIGTKVFKK